MECDDCREEKEDVEETICPYVEELYGERRLHSL